jgi:hypothetical protein
MADEGQSGALKIERLAKGDTTRTARHAEVMNEIIDAINAMRNGKVIRSGSGKGKLLHSDSNMVIDLGDLGREPPVDENHYDFEMVDASDADGPKVLIYDGVVYGPNDDGIYPDGMPSDDNNYVLPVADGDEVWLVITFDVESDDGVSGEQITSVSFDHGPTTPDDEFPTMYFTVGSVSVDEAGVLQPINEILGDLNIWLPPDNGGDSLNDLALVVDKDTGNRVWKKVCA